jgi:hypothetical protein
MPTDFEKDARDLLVQIIANLRAYYEDDEPFQGSDAVDYLGGIYDRAKAILADARKQHPLFCPLSHNVCGRASCAWFAEDHCCCAILLGQGGTK